MTSLGAGRGRRVLSHPGDQHLDQGRRRFCEWRVAAAHLGQAGYGLRGGRNHRRQGASLPGPARAYGRRSLRLIGAGEQGRATHRRSDRRHRDRYTAARRDRQRARHDEAPKGREPRFRARHDGRQSVRSRHSCRIKTATNDCDSVSETIRLERDGRGGFRAVLANASVPGLYRAEVRITGEDHQLGHIERSQSVTANRCGSARLIAQEAQSCCAPCGSSPRDRAHGATRRPFRKSARSEFCEPHRACRVGRQGRSRAGGSRRRPLSLRPVASGWPRSHAHASRFGAAAFPRHHQAAPRHASKVICAFLTRGYAAWRVVIPLPPDCGNLVRISYPHFAAMSRGSWGNRERTRALIVL